MPARLARDLIYSRYRYVCLSCHLQELSLTGGQTRRYRHTGPPANGEDNTKQESIEKELGTQDESISRSRIGDIIRSFMFKPNGKDKEIKDDSKTHFLRKNEQSSTVPENVPLTKPQPKDSPEVSQQKLQEKFAAQRRKDIIAMQASQIPKIIEKSDTEPKARSVPEPIKQITKKSSARAERKAETKRKIKEVALEKKAKKLLKKLQDKPGKAPQNDIAEIATSKRLKKAEGSPTSIESPAKRTQETSRAEGKDLNDRYGDGTDNVQREQTVTAQKLDDIMDILESSKNPKKPDKTLNVAQGMEDSSTSTKIKKAVVATLSEFQKKETPITVNNRSADSIISRYSSQLLARLKANAVETTGSFDQSKLEELLKRALLDTVGRDSTVRKNTKRSPSIPTSHVRLRKHASLRPVRKVMANDSKSVLRGQSLRAVLKQKSANVKDANLEATQNLTNEKIENAIAPHRSLLEKVPIARAAPKLPVGKSLKSKGSNKSPIAIATATELEMLPVTVDQPPVPKLAYGLERVLFNPGVYQLQDPRSRVYNFDPYLQKIMPIEEFDFNALKEYITSSRDESLNRIAKEHGKRYMGSTSSMTEVLAQFHFLLSQWRPINPSMLSKDFPVPLTSFTEFQRIPSAIFLRWKDGSYAIDADKQFATANVLSMLGKSMEKLLTLNTDDFERYRKSNPDQVAEDDHFAPESYHYSTLGDFLMRSQLDAHDPRLPGTGMFDLKTRSVVSIRMDVANYEHGVGYEIKDRQGEWESYEREYYDMIRAAFLKYSLQVRMGRMDGIFVAFHNIERIFGFQYISLPEMDSTLHGQRDLSIGDQEFKLSLDLMNKILDRATKKYPETSLRIFFETRDAQTPFMYIFAEPVTEEQVIEIQSQNSAKIQEFERNILGLKRGDDSDSDDAQDIDPKWKEIQADVQKAMERDELAVDGANQNQEAVSQDAVSIDSALGRPELFEQGPLYARKGVAGAYNNATAASAEDGDDGDESELDDEFDEDQREDEEEGEEEHAQVSDGDANETGEVEKNRRPEELEDFLGGKVNIDAVDVFEAERKIGGDGVEENEVSLSKSHQIGVQNDADLLIQEPNEDDKPDVTFGQEENNETREPRTDESNTSVSPDEEPVSIAETEGQHEHQTHADAPFLDSIIREAAQEDGDAESSPSTDILAMTLTVRNRVNGEYVLRPEKMTEADEWSVEYSLTEVPEPTRARALYKACQRRRSKKHETLSAPEDAEFISSYIKRLRGLSLQGRRWRKQQDDKDKQVPVEVL